MVEYQIELDGEGLDEEDKYPLDIRLESIETSSGDTYMHWLVAIQAAWESQCLRERSQMRPKQAV